MFYLQFRPGLYMPHRTAFSIRPIQSLKLETINPKYFDLFKTFLTRLLLYLSDAVCLHKTFCQGRGADNKTVQQIKYCLLVSY